jgi:hypothetical protein
MMMLCPPDQASGGQARFCTPTDHNFRRIKRRGGQPGRLSPATDQPLFAGAGGVGVPSLFGATDSIMRLQLSIMRDIFCCMS